ncbi:unnamed protein product [Adineta steineri]|uniref:G-protein coupled receptors family 1 profile domain-containing protein n=1 Tax=Adineta steineri TaxID=433720 RepID=A0A818HBN7_9BILA|nr:unnamed protein product [Adineta steineri]CAF0870765.1 unnamed protein product [Adineta steineri]CAF3503783.1 unnamed protein product [Adineta steineri]CAF3815327.1 unnamed protein product [Adineta steineri]
MWHELVRLSFVRIFYPCLMIFGTVGNILCLIILLRKRFRHQSTCQYLCVLVVIDILFIYTRSTRYIYRYIYNADLRNASVWICRSLMFFSSTLSHLASWILVIVSFDRYFRIKNLFARRHIKSRVIQSTCILIFIVCTVNLHYFHILGIHVTIQSPIVHINNNILNETSHTITRFVCMPLSSFKTFFQLYVSIFDLLFVAIIPFCLMMFTNIGIICTIMRTNRLCATSREQQQNNRLTVMLLSVTLAFMLLTCPSVIYICLNRLTSSKTAVSNRRLLILDLLEALWYTKHALNFILYTLSGQDFRQEFMKLFPCSRQKTTNISMDQQRNRNNRLNIAINIYVDNTTLVNQRLLDNRKKLFNKEDNDVSIIIISKTSKIETPV